MRFLDKLLRRRASAPTAPEPAPLPYPRRSLQDHLSPAGRKRILALDGGGVRGIMSIALLERIEDILRARHGNHPDFRLSHYYDMIGGTSTGSIIAAALAAKQMKASEIGEIYRTLAPKVFKKPFLRIGIFFSVFDGERLLAELRNVFGDMTLGAPEIDTGFSLVAKRADTNSTWVMHNHPDGIYFRDPPDRSYLGNRHYPLVNIIRASTAAPWYFAPERIEILKGQQYGLFVDGGTTPHNNPSFQMLMLAGLRNYNFGWSLHHENLLMTSIGTGSMGAPGEIDRLSRRRNWERTRDGLTSMISSSEDFIEFLMQWISYCPDPKEIDSEIGDLRDDFLTDYPLATYCRYQSELSQAFLERELGLSLTAAELKTLREMTDPQGMEHAYEVGQRMAELFIRESHFPAAFDLTAEDEPAHPGEASPPVMHRASTGALPEAPETAFAAPEAPLEMLSTLSRRNGRRSL